MICRFSIEKVFIPLAIALLAAPLQSYAENPLSLEMPVSNERITKAQEVLTSRQGPLFEDAQATQHQLNSGFESTTKTKSPQSGEAIDKFGETYASLSDINYSQIESKSCKEFNRIEIPSINKYPLELHLNRSLFNSPFKSYIHQKHPYPPIIVWVLFTIALLIALLSANKRINVQNKSAYKFLFYTPGIISVIIFLAWANLQYMNTQINERKEIDSYVKLAPIITTVYEILSPWVWPDNPAAKVNAHIISTGILNAFKSGNLLAAGKYAEYDNIKETIPLREEAFLQAAQHLYQDYKLEEAVSYAEKALKLTGSTRAYETQQKIRAILVVSLASDGNFEKSQAEFRKLDSDWYNNLRNKSLSAVVDLHLRALLQKGNQFEFQKAANIINGYLQFASQQSTQAIPQQLQCLYGSFLEEIGKEAFEDGRETDVIKALTVVESLIDNAPVASKLLIQSFYRQGRHFLEHGETEKAVLSLREAHNREPNNKHVKCSLSVALMDSARNFAYLNNVDKSKTRSEEADSLCKFNGIQELHASIYLTYGQWYMRYGDWEKARVSFEKSLKYNTPNTFDVASQLFRDTFPAQKRIRKLQDIRQWVDNIPRVTGSLCYLHENQPNDCSTVQLFDGARMVGMAYQDMSGVEFEADGKNLVLKDTVGDGRIDTAEVSEGRKRRVIVEIDGDYRLDGELIFDENGKKIYEKIYSGSVLIRVPHGAIAKQFDFWSAPDAYLTFYKNDSWVGRTDVVKNTHFPSWPQAFSTDYRKGDIITIGMWDRNFDSSHWFNALFGKEKRNLRGKNDDPIDKFVISKLPESDILTGEDGNAAIEVQVTPTTLPEGVYDVKDTEQVNTFRYADFGGQNREVQIIVAKAQRAQERSATMATIASWTLPEIATMAILSKERFATQLLFSYIGSEATYEVLKNSD